MDCENKLYAIREVSELTGVKPVTLRAWQRRYNIIQPQRTEKGHRLYTEQHLEQIKAIQAWLAKGVAIGKVKGLLESGDLNASVNEQTSRLEEVEPLLQALAELSRHRAESTVAAVFKEYPLNIVESRFVNPIFAAIEQMKKGQRSLHFGLIQSIFSAQLSAIIESENKAAHKGKCLVVSFDILGALSTKMWSLSLLEQGLHISLLEGVSDISGLIDHPSIDKFTHLALHSSQAPSATQVKLLNRLAEQLGDKLISNDLLTSLMAVTE